MRVKYLGWNYRAQTRARLKVILKCIVLSGITTFELAVTSSIILGIIPLQPFLQVWAVVMLMLIGLLLALFTIASLYALLAGWRLIGAEEVEPKIELPMFSQEMRPPNA